MDRTDALLARASQYLRAGTARPAPLPTSTNRNTTDNDNRRNAKAKAAEDEVEAYLKSLTGAGGEKVSPGKSDFAQKASASLPLPAASVPLSGRGRSFLKTKEIPSQSQNQPPKNETIEVPLQTYSAKEPVRSRTMSSSSYSSPSPPISPVRHQVKAVVKHQSSEETDEIDDDDDEAANDQRLVAEHFRQALKTSGSLKNSIEQAPKQKLSAKKEPSPLAAERPHSPPKRAPLLASTHDSAPIISSSFIDDSGNIIYSLTFEEDEEGEKDQTDEGERSEPDVDEEEDESPINLLNVVQSVEELLSGSIVAGDEAPPVHVERSRFETANSLDSIAESIASRPASVASTESPKSQVADHRYSDDFDESSKSTVEHLPRAPLPTITDEKPEKHPENLLSAPPILNLLSARSTEAHSVTTTQIVEESVAVPLSESISTEIDTFRKRTQSQGSQSFLRLPLGKSKTVPTFSKQPQEVHEPPRYSEPRENRPKSGAGKDAGIQASFPEGYQPSQNIGFPFPQQMFGGNVPPLVVMMPPQSFFQQYMAPFQQVPQTRIPPPSEHVPKLEEEKPQPQQKPPIIAQPSIYLPLFLERSNVRMLVAQCRMLTESINATRIAYERRISNIQQRK